MRMFALAAAVFAAVLSLGPAKADDPAPVMLTVIGAVQNTNRPAFDAFRDSFFKFHDKDFKKAFEFTRADLKALPQVTIQAKAANWPNAVTATGPRLTDVLSQVGISEKSEVTLFALDGYGVEMDAGDRAAQDWVLAIDADGKPLPLGGRGPTWLLYDTGGEPASEDAEAKWVWSVFLIAVE